MVLLDEEDEGQLEIIERPDEVAEWYIDKSLFIMVFVDLWFMRKQDLIDFHLHHSIISQYGRCHNLLSIKVCLNFLRKDDTRVNNIIISIARQEY